MTAEEYRLVMVILCSVLIVAFVGLGIRFTGSRAAAKRSQENDPSRIQSCVASLLALFGAVAIPCVYYLAYIFPKTLAMWADQGNDLTIPQATTAQLSNLCQPIGFLLMLSLFSTTIACTIWAVYARKRQQHEGTES